MASKGEMIVKMRNEFIQQAVEVEDREAAEKRVVAPMEVGRSLDLTFDREARSVEGSRWAWPHPVKKSCDLRRYARGIFDKRSGLE